MGRRATSTERSSTGGRLRARVVRISERAQPGEHVPHFGTLEVGGGAAGPRRDGALLERRRDHGALALDGPDQDADPLGRDAGRDQLLGLGGHGLCLSPLRASAPEPHAPAAHSGETPGKHGRGGVEDAPTRAAVPLQLHDPGVGELLEEARVGAHDHHLPALLDQEPEEQALGEGGLLVLVHQHVLEPARDALAHVRALVQQLEGAEHEIAEVERAARGARAGGGALPPRPHEPPRGAGAGGVGGGLGGEALGVGLIGGGRDGLVLQPVDARDEAREERGGVAADLVRAQRQVVEPLEEQSQPVGGRDG